MESISEQLKQMLEEREIYTSGNLLKCILGLNELESNIFSYLLKNGNACTKELSNVFDKDRSSIQRALQNLFELKVIKRDSLSLKEFFECKGKEEDNKRGYLYVYSARDINFVKKEFRKLLDKWYASMIKYIDSIFDCYETEGKLC